MEGITLNKPHGKVIGVSDKVTVHNNETDVTDIDININNDSDDNENDQDGHSAIINEELIDEDDNENANIADETSEDDDMDDIDLSDVVNPKTITIDNKEVYKSNVLKQFYSSQPLSKDRLKRVRGVTKTAGYEKDSGDGVENLDSLIYCGDPVVWKRSDICVIANIVKIKLANKNIILINRAAQLSF